MLAGLLYGVVEALITALVRLELHADRRVHAWSSLALAVMPERPVRPRRGEEGVSDGAADVSPMPAAIAAADRGRARAWRSTVDGYTPSSCWRWWR